MCLCSEQLEQVEEQLSTRQIEFVFTSNTHHSVAMGFHEFFDLVGKIIVFHADQAYRYSVEVDTFEDIQFTSLGIDTQVIDVVDIVLF